MRQLRKRRYKSKRLTRAGKLTRIAMDNPDWGYKVWHKRHHKRYGHISRQGLLYRDRLIEQLSMAL